MSDDAQNPTSTEHTLKTWSAYWDALESGAKNFEVRRDDRGFQRGDVLVLECWDPEGCCYVCDGFGFSAEPKQIRRRITYILTGGQFGIQPGFVVMGLENVNVR